MNRSYFVTPTTSNFDLRTFLAHLFCRVFHSERHWRSRSPLGDASGFEPEHKTVRPLESEFQIRIQNSDSQHKRVGQTRRASCRVCSDRFLIGYLPKNRSGRQPCRRILAPDACIRRLCKSVCPAVYPGHKIVWLETRTSVFV